MFDTFDAEIGERARQAQVLAAQVARLAKQLQRAAEAADLHQLRQRVADTANRASEAAGAIDRLRRDLEAFSLLPASGEDAGAAYGRDFERACAAAGVPLEGSYPDYRVFPFEVHLRPEEERAVLGRRSCWTIRPQRLASVVKRERDRLLGGAFAAERFGAALVRAYDVLILEVRATSGSAAQQVSLRRVLDLLQLPTFGRISYTKDEFAFDIYRYRQAEMRVGGRDVALLDVRGAGAGFEVPNARGGWERLNALQVTPAGAAGDA